MKEITKDRYEFISYDRRVVERNLKRHHLTISEYQKHLKSLPDDQAFAEELLVYKEKEVPPPSV